MQKPLLREGLRKIIPENIQKRARDRSQREKLTGVPYFGGTDPQT